MQTSTPAADALTCICMYMIHMYYIDLSYNIVNIILIIIDDSIGTQECALTLYDHDLIFWHHMHMHVKLILIFLSTATQCL